MWRYSILTSELTICVQNSKCRCDLQEPTCGRCSSKSLSCQYDAIQRSGRLVKLTGSNTSSTHTPGRSVDAGAGTPASALTGAASTGTPADDYASTSATAENLPITPEQASWRLAKDLTIHTMTFIIRVLKTWPAMIGRGSRSPPFIHQEQGRICPSGTLFNCACQLKLWYDEAADRVVLRRAFQRDMDAVVGKMGQYDDLELLCAAQAYIIYSIVLLFVDSAERDHTKDQEVILKLQDITLDLASTGLFLKAEKDFTMPTWQEWILMAAKRRTVLVSHLICWAWSVSNGYPDFLCREIGFMPTVEAKTLWQARDEGGFHQSYATWLANWTDGPHTMQELMLISPGVELPERTERWLQDVDELGMMLMSEVNAV